jgi:hypothetical protein
MDQLAIAALRQRAMRVLLPPRRLPLSEWIEGNIRLPEEGRRIGIMIALGAIPVINRNP